MTSHTYEIKLDNIFEGPMDLLVHLIKKHEVDIYDIPIALITDQFLAYLEWMESLNIEVASDFLVMAATLAHIKSRMLLPRRGNDPVDEEEEDFRLEIAGQLLEYLKIKDVAEQLAERPMLDEDVFTRSPDKSSFLIDPEEEVVKTDLFDLISAYHKLLDTTSTKAGIRIIPERVSIKDRMTEIINILEDKGTITFVELLSKNSERIDIVVTFLAILEIVKLKLVRIVQNGQKSGLRLFYT
ncbi:MAG: segregation/condensation protein A [Desulfobacteraceae bacterium]|nr:segregation/condensation protein A [Desulfobacteraceae bacterium]MBC2755323.1 segregation/condensation protein A [Desulfobacteraceae bacterium]